MTREELKREAKEYADKYGKSNFDLWDTARFAYYQGAEPREKCIEELEAEVKEWKDKADLWCKTANLKDHNIMINKELEKENAELRKVAEFGYNKANEWHYPSKGELPKCDEKTQLIFYVNCYYEIDGETITRKRTVLGYYQNSFLNDDIKLFVEKSKGYEDEHLPKDVIAWKEIVLPGLKENK